MPYDYLARFSYERLVLTQPQLAFAGLWRSQHRYYAVSPELTSETVTDDGKPLVAWCMSAA